MIDFNSDPRELDRKVEAMLNLTTVSEQHPLTVPLGKDIFGFDRVIIAGDLTPDQVEAIDKFDTPIQQQLREESDVVIAQYHLGEEEM